MTDHVSARLAALERRVKHLEAYIVAIESGIGQMIGHSTEAPFVQRLRNLDQQDERERAQ